MKGGNVISPGLNGVPVAQSIITNDESKGTDADTLFGSMHELGGKLIPPPNKEFICKIAPVALPVSSNKAL